MLIVLPLLTNDKSYGISRVYAEQCSYVLSDLQNVQSTIRTYLATVRTAGIDLAVQKTRLATTPALIILANDFQARRLIAS
jgi:hypothetical protein